MAFFISWLRAITNLKEMLIQKSMVEATHLKQPKETMKNEELLAILNGEQSVEEKAAAIQKLNGIDRTTSIETTKTSLTEQFNKDKDSLKTQWQTEWEQSAKEKYVPKSDYDTAFNELSKFKEKEESGKRSTYLASLGVKSNYTDLLASKINWDELSYDDTKKTYTGDKLEETTKSLKEQYSDLFEQTKSPEIKGYFQDDKGKVDLTKL